MPARHARRRLQCVVTDGADGESVATRQQGAGGELNITEKFPYNTGER